MKCATYLIKSQPLIQRYLKGAIYINNASPGGIGSPTCYSRRKIMAKIGAHVLPIAQIIIWESFSVVPRATFRTRKALALGSMRH
jgi:hypothetical protein